MLEHYCGTGTAGGFHCILSVLEWVHLAHHTPAYRPRTRMGLALRDAHMRHHFHNENYNGALPTHWAT